MAKNMKTLKELKKLIVKAEEYVETAWKENEAIPSISGCALFLGVPRRTLRQWMDTDYLGCREPFPELRDKLLALQEVRLLSAGLQGTFTPSITKLVLHQHGYSDKSETDLTSSDGSMAKPDKIIVVGKSADNDNGDN